MPSERMSDGAKHICVTVEFRRLHLCHRALHMSSLPSLMAMYRCTSCALSKCMLVAQIQGPRNPSANKTSPPFSGMQDELVREYDMPFGFCIPNSVNTWDAQYDMPLYTDEQVQEFVRSSAHAACKHHLHMLCCCLSCWRSPVSLLVTPAALVLVQPSRV